MTQIAIPPLRLSPNTATTYTARREYGQIPGYSGGIDFAGRWVVRDRVGVYRDHSSFRDSLERRFPDTDFEE